MPSVGAGVLELRIHTELEHRIFYVAKFAEGIYVLHAFQKTTPRTRQADIELAQERFSAVLEYRRQEAARRKREE